VFGRGNNYEETIKVSGHTEKEKNPLGLNHPICDGLEEQLDGPLCRLKWTALASSFI